jgi:hypothetical protein
METLVLHADPLVYEQYDEIPGHTHRLRLLVPHEIHLYLLDESRPYCWRLGDERTNYPTHDARLPGSRRDHASERYIRTATSVTGTHTWKHLKSGIEVLYKKDESDVVVLHALSIPWESLINKLLKDHSPQHRDDGSGGKTAEYFEV